MSELTNLADKLTSEGERFIAFFGDLTDAQWQADVYTEGAVWTVRNVLSHFVTSERGLVKLFEQIRQGGAGVADGCADGVGRAAEPEHAANVVAHTNEPRSCSTRCITEAPRGVAANRARRRTGVGHPSRGLKADPHSLASTGQRATRLR